MKEALLSLKNVSKAFDGKTVLDSLDLDILDGEFITLLGPSGCGKTTLLRLMAGFEQPDTGSVTLSGHDITHAPPEHRPLNTVFQNYALFPHMSVYDNVAYGLKMEKRPKEEIRQRVDEVLAMVQLQNFARRKPHQLSGGQQQRVAIARAVVKRPQLLLLDEPLSALDYKLRRTMQVELKRLQRELGITFVFVTHDQEEALSMSDRVVVLKEGEIQQLGTPREIYERPANLFTARFVGETNLFPGYLEAIADESITVEIPAPHLAKASLYGAGGRAGECAVAPGRYSRACSRGPARPGGQDRGTQLQGQHIGLGDSPGGWHRGAGQRIL